MDKRAVVGSAAGDRALQLRLLHATFPLRLASVGIVSSFVQKK